MFRPDSNRDRTDYSGILMPPDGYRLDRAVGTTYSLDLEALTAVAICLGLSEETDSKLMQNPIGMLNALRNHPLWWTALSRQAYRCSAAHRR